MSDKELIIFNATDKSDEVNHKLVVGLVVKSMTSSIEEVRSMANQFSRQIAIEDLPEIQMDFQTF